MGKANKTRKFATVKRMITQKDGRLQANQVKKDNDNKSTNNPDIEKRKQVKTPDSNMFFEYNKNLVPPYNILVDTNFLNFSIQHKMDVLQGMMDCLTAKCNPMVTDCIIGELEKMGHKFSLALKLAKDPRFIRLKCNHKGTYADDCLTQRVTDHKCFIVATNDKDLRRRIRKIPGVPIMYVTNHKYAIERMPDTVTAIPSAQRTKLN